MLSLALSLYDVWAIDTASNDIAGLCGNHESIDLLFRRFGRNVIGDGIFCRTG